MSRLCRKNRPNLQNQAQQKDPCFVVLHVSFFLQLKGQKYFFLVAEVRRERGLGSGLEFFVVTYNYIYCHMKVFS